MNWLILIYFTRPHHHPDQGSTVSGWPYRLHPWGPSTKAKLLTCILRAARVGCMERNDEEPPTGCARCCMKICEICGVWVEGDASYSSILHMPQLWRPCSSVGIQRTHYGIVLVDKRTLVAMRATMYIPLVTNWLSFSFDVYISPSGYRQSSTTCSRGEGLQRH
jgi:hypothetical protein